jgi:lysophospholipase L1-like esterase
VPNARRHPLRYVALGDSFASAPLVPVTDVANGCFRSSNNYPSLVARKLHAKLDDHSCGGAQTSHLSSSQYPDVPAQLPAVQPGVNLVTIGIGGNDEGLFRLLTSRCPQLRASDPEGAPCQAAMSSTGSDVLLQILGRTQARITAAVREVHQRAPDAKVLVVGYPQIVAADHACAKLPLARGDYAYAARINLALTETLRKAAQATGNTYVDVYSASKGHDVCSADPWVNGSVTDEKRAAAFHPFAVEQEAVASLVVAAFRG